ncbi:septum formation protein [Glaciihabitans tibetensis]|uniref:Nucleoside triphosphate pyrophosphatase n=1 Tax=Glaciihabitans tibetensis TaxID=1266600 RepID=A0A2T0VFN2_9MICO|nr:Maf family protein [Glaciihabitans tibetensis]PRY68864.1 septum formation protein [Glaciihabitans tibetensis]
MRLYLASTSPARLATLRAAGIEPILLPSFVDEDAAVADAIAAGLGSLPDGTLTGPEMVLLLARAKAEAVVGRLVDGEPIDGIILGGDSAFELDGVISGKPHLPAVARERWLLQRGREGLLHSGHWTIDHRGGVAARGVATPGGAAAGEGTGLLSSGPAGPVPVAAGVGDVSTTSVRFADNITDAEIDAYIATGEPLEVAGAFTIDGLGAAFISEVRGDPHAVVGLSLAQLRQLLLQFDVSWPTLWNRSA